MRKKQSGQKWRIFAFDRTTGVPVTGDAVNLTAKISIDHGAATSITDINPVETEDGYYLFDLEESETDGDVLSLYPESSTADVQVIGSPADVTITPTVEDIDGYLISQHGGDTWDVDEVIRRQSNLVVAAVVSVTSNTVFTITSNVASTDDDAYNGYSFKLRSSLDSRRFIAGKVTDYVGSTQQITLDSSAQWTVIPNDLLEVDLLVSNSSITAIMVVVSAIQSVLSGMTSLPNWLRALFRKDTADATALVEINTGGGGYDEATDSLEGVRDRGDAAWVTGSGGGSGLTIEQIRQEMDAALAMFGVSVSSPKDPNSNTITIVRGDDYTGSTNRTVMWTGSSVDQWSDLTGVAITFTAIREGESVTKSGAVVSATGTQSFQVELTASETDVSVGWWDYDVQATFTNGDIVTLVIGRMRVMQDYS